MDLSAELIFRVERLIEWNLFDRLLRPTITVTSRFKNELERHAPLGRVPDAEGWGVLRTVGNTWVADDDGTLVFFVNTCQHINRPFNGRNPFDFGAKLNELVVARNEIVVALRDGSVGPLRTHSETVENVLKEINLQRRGNHESELNQLLTAVGRLQQVPAINVAVATAVPAAAVNVAVATAAPAAAGP